MNTTGRHFRGAERDVRRKIRLVEPLPQHELSQDELPQREAPPHEVPQQPAASQAWYVPEIHEQGEGSDDDPFTTLRPVHPLRPHDAAGE